MRRTRALSLVLVGTVQMLCYLPIAHAQISEKLQRCLPYPTFDEEVQSMRQEEEAKAGESVVGNKIIVDSVKFDGPISLPDSIRQRVVAELKQQRFPADSEWLNEIADGTIMRAWEDDGYFKVVATAKAELWRSDSAGQHVAVTVRVDEGPQFFLGNLAFRSADPDEPLAFTREELRKQVPLQEGSIFAADKIRGSLERFRHLYVSEGYIDFTAEPEFDIDAANRRINLTLVLDQQRQYRVGRIIVLGLNPKLETALLSKINPGDVFNPSAIHEFILENKSALPWDASSADMKMKRNIAARIVDLTFDFFTCRTD